MSRETQLGLFQCRYPACLSYLRTYKLKYAYDMVNPSCPDPACGKGMFNIYSFQRRIGFIEKILNFFKQLKLKPKKKTIKKVKDLFDKFNEENLHQWIKPGEFSFGPTGANNTLQPGPHTARNNDKNYDVSEETQITRYNLALERKNAGLPPIFWMPFNQDKVPEELKHLV